MSDEIQRVAILGASRGLGRALAHKIETDHPLTQLWLASRRIEPRGSHLASQNPILFPMDFTKDEDFTPMIQSFLQFKPQKIFYCAGGGPFGPFEQHEWHSHEWAYRLNLLFPSRLLHAVLNLIGSDKLNSSLQLIFIGSSIAEAHPDPGASSYSSSKHGLYGLLRSVREELKNSSQLDLRLFSPGYMDTSLLPKNSRPRHDGSKIAPVEKIADDLLLWAQTPILQTSWHKSL